jgi:hypothetical protein
MDSLVSYLKPFGEKALIDDNLLEMKGLTKHRYLLSNEQLILDNSWELELVTDDF